MYIILYIKINFKTHNVSFFLGNLLSTVEDYAFSDMAALRAIYLAMMDSLTDISIHAFSGITNLTQLSLYGNKAFGIKV